MKRFIIKDQKNPKAAVCINNESITPEQIWNAFSQYDIESTSDISSVKNVTTIEEANAYLQSVTAKKEWRLYHL